MAGGHRLLILLLSAKIGVNCDTSEIISLTAGSSACTLSGMPKKKVAMWLDTDQIKALKAISKKSGIPMSVLIRRGVDWTIKKHSGNKY